MDNDRLVNLQEKECDEVWSSEKVGVENFIVIESELQPTCSGTFKLRRTSLSLRILLEVLTKSFCVSTLPSGTEVFFFNRISGNIFVV